MEVYLYSVRWFYDDCKDGKMITSSGIVAAENMADATKRLTSEIFNDVEEVHLYALEGSDSGYAPLSAIKSVAEEKNLIDEE